MIDVDNNNAFKNMPSPIDSWPPRSIDNMESVNISPPPKIPARQITKYNGDRINA